MKRILKIALFGTPGAGKSTTSLLIEDYCRSAAYSFHRIKLADPLYEIQSYIYGVARRPLADFYDQDGELLTFLGGYLRKLNPAVLLDRFAERLAAVEAELPDIPEGQNVVVCDDMRRPDAEYLRERGFVFICISASEEQCKKRRLMRGDRSLSSLQHPVERGLDEIVRDATIVNEGTFDDLRQQVASLLGRLLDDSNWSAYKD
jgi:dephospho-CoA kinase